jgi:hypothetical protein
MTFPFRREGAALLIIFFSPDFLHDAYAQVAPFPQRAAAAFRAHSRRCSLVELSTRACAPLRAILLKKGSVNEKDAGRRG